MQSKGATDAKLLEGFVIKQLLKSSGAFRGTEAAGSSLTQDLFADTLAEAVALSGGMGLSPLMTPAPPAVPHHRTGPAHAPAHLVGQTSGFGQRRDPITGELSNHTGVDIGAAEGTPIPAAMDGVVISAGPRGGYGNAVEIAHADGTTTLYAHASEVAVTPGDTVKAGDLIAYVGQTGRSTGPHLHLEHRSGTARLDPTLALKLYRLRAEDDRGGSP